MRPKIYAITLMLFGCLLVTACAQGVTPEYTEEEAAPDTQRPGKLPERLNNGDTTVTPVELPQDMGSPDNGPEPDLTPEPDFADPGEPDQGEDPPEPDLPPEEDIPTGPTDNDNDSWFSDEDCDDNNPQISPSSAELCGDNLDNNCNGQVDEGCDGPPPGEVGASCGSDQECAQNICLTGWPGNYCTALCNGSACPVNASCVGVPLNNGDVAPLCLRDCNSRADCRSDQACLLLEDGVQVCAPACTSDSECRQGSCDPVTGLCQ